MTFFCEMCHKSREEEQRSGHETICASCCRFFHGVGCAAAGDPVGFAERLAMTIVLAAEATLDAGRDDRSTVAAVPLASLGPRATSALVQELAHYKAPEHDDLMDATALAERVTAIEPPPIEEPITGHPYRGWPPAPLVAPAWQRPAEEASHEGLFNGAYHLGALADCPVCDRFKNRRKRLAMFFVAIAAAWIFWVSR